MMTKHGQAGAGLCIRTWKIVILCYVCLTPMVLLAQTAKPEVRVSLYFARELDACHPDGYPDADDQTPRSCEVLTFDDLENMVSRGLTKPVQRSIPPEQVRLGDALLDSIDAYGDDCPLSRPCLDSSRRYVIILPCSAVFDRG